VSPGENFNIVYQKSFVDILVKVARESRTGVLRSRGTARPFEIHVEKGWVVNVTGEFPGEPSIEEIIARSGFLDAATFQRILKRIRRSKTPFVAYVIKKELFSEVFLKRILENVIRERLNRVLEMQNFGIDFEKSSPTPLKNLSYIHLPAYLRRYRNEFDARKLVRQHFAVDQVFPAPAKGAAGIENDSRFDVDARIVYVFINGRRTFRDISYISGLGYVRTGVALLRLMKTGMIELRDRPRQDRKALGVAGRAVFHVALPVLFAALFALGLGLSPKLREPRLYDRDQAQRAQSISLFRRATEYFERLELRAPSGPEELFERGLLDERWRPFKRTYERALQHEKESRD
jgi:hypothetical protein